MTRKVEQGVTEGMERQLEEVFEKQGKIHAVFIVKKPGESRWKGLGTHTFDVLPREGEMIVMNNEEGIGVYYRVAMVAHPHEPAGAVDIYAAYAGEITEVLENLFQDLELP